MGFEAGDKIRYKVDGREGKVYTESHRPGWWGIIWKHLDGSYGKFISTLKGDEIELIEDVPAIIASNEDTITIDRNKFLTSFRTFLTNEGFDGRDGDMLFNYVENALEHYTKLASKIDKSEIDKDYKLMCDCVAEDIRNGEDTLENVTRDTIHSIRSREFLSDFEKITRDYFEVNRLELNAETLKKDIEKFL